jgi:hypothetical protein
MAVKTVKHLSVDDRKARGLEARDAAPLSSHTKWSPAADRPERRLSPDDVLPVLHDQFRAYRATLQDDRRKLLERFEIVDAVTSGRLEALAGV